MLRAVQAGTTQACGFALSEIQGHTVVVDGVSYDFHLLPRYSFQIVLEI